MQSRHQCRVKQEGGGKTKKVITVILAFGLLISMNSILTVMATPKMTSPAWYMVPAEESSRETITYEGLSAQCIAAGLPENPYPTPTIPTRVLVGTILYIYGASSYHVFTLKVGDEVYEGVSCDVYDADLNLATRTLHVAYQATWYLGSLGKMNHGFAGSIDLTFYNYRSATSTTSESWDYFVISYDMEGFGHFNKQLVVLNGDTSVSTDIAGYCLVLGNRYK